MKKAAVILSLAALFVVAAPMSQASAFFLFPFPRPIERPIVFQKALIIPRLVNDNHEVKIDFLNLKNVDSIAYSLAYKANGTDQGVAGEIDVNGENHLTRTITLGTCSAASCVYHENVKKVKLEVNVTYKNGKSDHKNFLLKP